MEGQPPKKEVSWILGIIVLREMVPMGRLLYISGRIAATKQTAGWSPQMRGNCKGIPPHAPIMQVDGLW